MTPDFDVAIVGGGPAGTSTALHLIVREGIAPRRILILEKAIHPRDKPCAGAVSAWGLEALREIGVGVDVPHVPMEGLRVLSGPWVGETRGPLGAVVRRCEFDASLWRRVVSAGAVAHDGEGLVGLARTGGGFALKTTSGAWTCRRVAACDGAGSAVRKLLGLRESARRGHLYVAETPELESDAGPRRGLCDFDMRVADHGVQGYVWDFPVVIDGKRSVNRGIYHANFTANRDIKAHLVRAFEARGLDSRTLRFKPFSTRPLVPSAVLSLRGIVLVGEAAGIDATTGEGIAQAILTGKTAARHLARSLRTGDASLERYSADVLRSRVGRHLLQSAWLAAQVYGPKGAAWRAFLAQADHAREAGAAWYSGRPLGWRAKARLAVSLGWALTGARRYRSSPSPSG